MTGSVRTSAELASWRAEARTRQEQTRYRAVTAGAYLEVVDWVENGADAPISGPGVAAGPRELARERQLALDDEQEALREHGAASETAWRAGTIARVIGWYLRRPFADTPI